MVDTSPADDGAHDGGYLMGDMDRPLLRCPCRHCEGEGLIPEDETCLYFNYQPNTEYR